MINIKGGIMKIHNGSFSVLTREKIEILNVTSNVTKIIEESGITNGMVNVWIPHATAAIAVNEHDTELWNDILKVLVRLVPINGNYSHNAKYRWTTSEQNAHAHILSCLIKPNVTVPLENGKMQLGTWQSILIIEMDGSRNRRINVQVIGE